MTLRMAVSSSWKSSAMSRRPRPAAGLLGFGLGGHEALGARASLAAAGFEALLEGSHEVDDLGVVVRRLRRLDRFALAFLLDQGAQGVLVAVAELAGIEVAGLLLDDLLGDLQHLRIGPRVHSTAVRPSNRMPRAYHSAGFRP